MIKTVISFIKTKHQPTPDHLLSKNIHFSTTYETKHSHYSEGAANYVIICNLDKSHV